MREGTHAHAAFCVQLASPREGSGVPSEPAQEGAGQAASGGSESSPVCYHEEACVV